MTHHCYYTIFHDVTLSLEEQGGERNVKEILHFLVVTLQL